MTDKLDVRDAEESAKTSVRKEDVSQGENRKTNSHEEDNQGRFQGTLVPPSWQTMIPLLNQTLLAVRMSHKLQRNKSDQEK